MPRWQTRRPQSGHLAGEGVGVLPELVLCIEHVHVHQTVHVTKHVRDEASVGTLTSATGTHGAKSTHDGNTAQCQTDRGQLALQCGRIAEEGRAKELEQSVFVRSHDGVRCGVR